MKAILALEDGLWFEGEGFGAEAEMIGEVVFNTSLTGYQEILTDPSYKGQIVVMTNPHIGNYGINSEDVESRRVWVEGFVVKEVSPVVSNWRSEKTLDAYLKENGIPGIEGIDTRMLVKHIRTVGSKMAVLSTKELDPKKLIEKAKKAPRIEGQNLAQEVTCEKPYRFEEPLLAGFDLGEKRPEKYHVVTIDCGVKYNILRNMVQYGFSVEVVPAGTSAEEILKKNPDGVFVSNGPGDPAAVTSVVETIKGLLGKVPLFGICLGHQMIGLALGGETSKLKFGHHGGNHPVKDTATEAIEITSQNHNFIVDIDSLDPDDFEVTHINLNDQTLEGIRHKKLPLFSVQHHPENSPGPHDSSYLFERFYELIEKHKREQHA